jgi:hypothetical protein
MFISMRNRGYTRDCQQFAQGRFLLLLQPDSNDGAKMPIRALVRFVRLSQLGHFMMGYAFVKGERLSVSGSYGSDGLPMSVTKEIYDLGVPLPDNLHKAWNEGGGWNGAGNEAPLMREWALATFPAPKQKNRCSDRFSFWR